MRTIVVVADGGDQVFPPGSGVDVLHDDGSAPVADLLTLLGDRAVIAAALATAEADVVRLSQELASKEAEIGRAVAVIIGG
jgi:hypothetical protein